jgi:haloalkane dehalogenase
MSQAIPTNPDDPHPRRRVRVLDSEISYIDTGAGEPVVFLHGNPTYSYLWRNIIPYVSGFVRCLAPDLIGMGDSGKSPQKGYRFIDHAAYLDAWFEALGLTRNVTLVLHDWGSALGFYRAHRFPEQIKAIAYMEAIALPRRWDDFGESAGLFKSLRSRAGESLIFDQNFFVETILPRGVLRPLTSEEMEAYRKPFRAREDRLPTLTWPRQIPVDGEPSEVHAIVESYGGWLARSSVPKLLFVGEPGAIITGRTRQFCLTFPNQRVVKVAGRHFLQEDSPGEIGENLAAFIRELP